MAPHPTKIAQDPLKTFVVVGVLKLDFAIRDVTQNLIIRQNEEAAPNTVPMVSDAVPTFIRKVAPIVRLVVPGLVPDIKNVPGVRVELNLLEGVSNT